MGTFSHPRTAVGPRSAFKQRRLISAAFGLTAAVLAASARAEPTAAERAIAETLYERGQAQMKDGNVAAACDSFAESERIDPGTGILLNLASCHETAGRLASAWVEYREAVVALRHEGRPDRLRFANEHLAAIEPRLAHLVIGGESPSDEGVVTVTLDGLELGRAAWGVAIPVDAGAHALAAHFRNGADWTTTVRVRDGERRLVEVPPAPAASNATSDGNASDRLQPALSAQRFPSAPTLSAATSDSGRPATVAKWQTAGLTLGAVGLVSLGVGGYLGLHAATLWSDRNHSCPMDICSRQGLAAGADAATYATAATWTIAGGVTALAGAFLLLLPSRVGERQRGTAARVMRSVQVNPAGRVAIGGSF